MQMYYHLKQLDEVNDVVFVNGELPEFMRQFIDQKMATEAENADAELDNDGDVLANAN